MEYTEENLIGKNLIDLAWKDDKRPREFTFIFYPQVSLQEALSGLVEIFQFARIYNPRITFNCTEVVPTIEIKSIFCLGRWDFYMEPDILKALVKLFLSDGIGIIWLEDQDFGISVDKDLIITRYWIPDGGG